MIQWIGEKSEPDRYMQLTPMTESDIDAVLVIEQQVFKSSWGRISFSGELSNKNSHNYVAKTDCFSLTPLVPKLQLENGKHHEGKIIAYICFHLIQDEMEILKIAVSPLWQKRGVASRLLDKSLAFASENGAGTAFLEVRPSNDPALRFYYKFGFQIMGKRLAYYPETGEDALILMKKLKKIP